MSCNNRDSQKLDDIFSDLQTSNQEFNQASDKFVQSRLQIRQLDLIQKAASMMMLGDNCSEEAQFYDDMDPDNCTFIDSDNSTFIDSDLSTINESDLSTISTRDFDFGHSMSSISSNNSLKIAMKTPDRFATATSSYNISRASARVCHASQDSNASQDLDNAIRLQVGKAKLIYVRRASVMSTTVKKSPSPKRKAKTLSLVTPNQQENWNSDCNVTPESTTSELRSPMSDYINPQLRRHSIYLMEKVEEKRQRPSNIPKFEPESWINGDSETAEFKGEFDNVFGAIAEEEITELQHSSPESVPSNEADNVDFDTLDGFSFLDSSSAHSYKSAKETNESDIDSDIMEDILDTYCSGKTKNTQEAYDLSTDRTSSASHTPKLDSYRLDDALNGLLHEFAPAKKLDFSVISEKKPRVEKKASVSSFMAQAGNTLKSLCEAPPKEHSKTQFLKKAKSCSSLKMRREQANVSVNVGTSSRPSSNIFSRLGFKRGSGPSKFGVF